MTYNTEKRVQISEFLSKRRDEAFSVDEIMAALSTDGGGRSTYYRIISSMVKEGAVRKITDDLSRHTTYQYLGGEHCAEHLHLKCKECGRLIHLDHETSHRLEAEILSAGGFALEEGTLLFGRCNDCVREGGKI